jgi:hypothetical protein
MRNGKQKKRKEEKVMRRIFAAVLLMVCMSLPGLVLAGDWNLSKNVKRLERTSPDYQDDKAIDKKFLDVLDLTEKTKKESDVYAEAKRITENTALAQSKYTDSFIYYMLVKAPGQTKSGTAELDYWLGLLKAHDKSPHLLAAQLIRLRLLPKNSPDIRRNVQLIVDWLKTQKPEFKLRSPEYTGNILLGYKPRANFAEGDALKLYTLSYYKGSVTPLAGFMDDETYVALLGRIKEGREDIMTEMIDIYKKAGKKKEAADILFQLAMLKATARDFEQAKMLLDNAVKLNPEHTQAKQERDKIKLELTYQSLAPAQQPAPAKQEEAAGIPEHFNQVEGYLTPVDRMVTAAELQDRSKAELRVMRNEVYAHHGRVFQDTDLHDYFSKKPWYRQNPAYSDGLLTDVDKENVRVIQEFENKAQ